MYVLYEIIWVLALLSRLDRSAIEFTNELIDLHQPDIKDTTAFGCFRIVRAQWFVVESHCTVRLSHGHVVIQLQAGAHPTGADSQTQRIPIGSLKGFPEREIIVVRCVVVLANILAC